MQIIRLFIITALMLGLLTGTIFNSLWWFLPEFHHLDAIFTVPLSLQVVFLASSIFSGLLLLRKQSHWSILPVFIFTIITLIPSWYQVNLSNSLNSLNISIFPIYEKKITFDKIRKIKIEGHKVLIIGPSETHTVYTGWFPFGLNLEALKKELASYGNCEYTSNTECLEFDFEWP